MRNRLPNGHIAGYVAHLKLAVLSITKVVLWAWVEALIAPHR